MMEALTKLIVHRSMKNRFLNYSRNAENSGRKVHPVHEIVNQFYIIRNMDNRPKDAYVGRFAYPKLASEAKRLLEECGGNLEDALWSLDKMNYKALKGGYDWSISTCLKHDLGWGTR